MTTILRNTIIVILITITILLGLRNAGLWLLVRNDIPKKIDLVFTFAGDRFRVNHSRELTEKFNNVHWVLSDFKNGYALLLRKTGFDMSRVSVVDTCTNTISEVRFLFDFLEHKKVILPEKPVVALVSSPYHMRRIKLMVLRQKKLRHIKFEYLPVPLEQYKTTIEMYKNWWRYSSISNVVFLELQKIFYFYIFQ